MNEIIKPRFSGIADLSGSEHKLAILRLGYKSQSGAPVDTMSFNICETNEIDGQRAFHPAFAAFNNAQKELRTTVYGNIMHSSVDECFGFQRMNYFSKSSGLPQHPNKLPFCEGDGRRARRWTGRQPDDFENIECTNDRCPFALSNECKAFMRFYFRIRWTALHSNKPIHPDFIGLPTPILKYVSRGWSMTKNFVGFFADIDRMIRGAGIQQYCLTGLPIVMHVYPMKRAGKRYPVVEISAECDILSFLNSQKQMIKYITDGVHPVGLLTPSEQSQEVIEADWRMVSVPSNYESSGNHIEKKRDEARSGLSFEQLEELASLGDEIPDDKLAEFVYYTCKHIANARKIKMSDAYFFMCGDENENGEITAPVSWEEAKHSIQVLRKYAKKAAECINSERRLR